MATPTDAVSAANTPANTYNAFLQLVYDNTYSVIAGDPAATARHNLKTGNQVRRSWIAWSTRQNCELRH